MSKRSKRELTEEIYPRYLKAGKAEKIRILDEFTAATGYHRKYAIKLLKHGLKIKGYKQVGERSTKVKWFRFSKRSGKPVEGYVQNDCIPFYPKWFQ